MFLDPLNALFISVEITANILSLQIAAPQTWSILSEEAKEKNIRSRRKVVNGYDSMKSSKVEKVESLGICTCIAQSFIIFKQTISDLFYFVWQRNFQHNKMNAITSYIKFLSSNSLKCLVFYCENAIRDRWMKCTPNFIYYAKIFFEFI